MDPEELKTTFELVERCHTGLADLFPHEGTNAIGGSRVFIGTALFPVLKDCIKDIRKALKKWPDREVWSVVDLLWAETVNLLARIEKEGRRGDMERINVAMKLLYLANGVGWNFLCERVDASPPHNMQYVRVEPIGPLLKICGRDETDIDLKQLAERLRVELNACLR